MKPSIATPVIREPTSGQFSEAEHSEDEFTPAPSPNNNIGFRRGSFIPVKLPEEKNPDTPRQIFNQNFKAKFAKLYVKIEEFSKNEELTYGTIEKVDDVDFVLVVNKSSTISLGFRLANWVAKMRKREPITGANLQEARMSYLNGLKDKYHLHYEVIETPERWYYLIQMSFHHIGLMMELLGYQWQLRSALPDKKAYKTFFFVKRKGDCRYKEYHLEKGWKRESFDARWRYNLAYYFLMGATVNMPYYNPWRNALKEPLMAQKARKEKLQQEDLENCEIAEATTVKEKGYSLMRLFSDNLFDDWMVLHSPAHKVTQKEVNAEFKKVKKSKNCCNVGCAVCFFPTITCQCSHVKSETLNNEFERRKGCSSFGVALCSIWRSFWYGNLIASIGLNVRKNEEGVEENTREYFGRIGTVRNALHLNSAPGQQEEKAAKFRHILPLAKLNSYFGEKIGFYFGWIELLLISLLAPAMIGVTMFLVGVIYYAWAIWHSPDEQEVADDYVTYILAKACDNYATPAFACIMIIWGTAFYEMWIRRQRWYAFLWQVEKLENTELERPPVYSFKIAAALRGSKYGAPFMYIPSVFTTLFFICLVFVSVYFINVMNIFSITYCPKPHHMQNSTDPSVTQIENAAVNSLICNLFGAAQVLANSLSMFILDAIFTRIAYHLTDFEGHLTQSEYTDALILKLFTFRFFNYYSVLFYIAFGVATQSVVYPAEITGGKRYDYESYRCGQQPCMALLSRQLLSVIVTQPFLNSIIDITLPILKLIYVTVKDAKKYLGGTKVAPDPSTEGAKNRLLAEELDSQCRLMELSSLDRREFTAEEFTDKLIVYGALVMFSVALPPAPALAFLIMRIDLNLDLGRLMTKFRRPLPLRVQDIGMWGNVINFLTFAGIITNPLIVVLTSSWGSRFDIWYKFVIFLVVEHVVFAVRMIVSFVVPDVPKSLIQQQQLHKLVKDEVQANLLREKTEFIIKSAKLRDVNV